MYLLNLIVKCVLTSSNCLICTCRFLTVCTDIHLQLNTCILCFEKHRFCIALQSLYLSNYSYNYLVKVEIYLLKQLDQAVITWASVISGSPSFFLTTNATVLYWLMWRECVCPVEQLLYYFHMSLCCTAMQCMYTLWCMEMRVGSQQHQIQQ